MAQTGTGRPAGRGGGVNAALLRGVRAHQQSTHLGEPAGVPARHPTSVAVFVRASQTLGIPLARIKAALADLPHDRPPTKQDWARLAEDWRADLDQRIAGLIALRDNLADCIGCGCLSLTTRPYVNPGDRLGKEGPGARKLLPD